MNMAKGLTAHYYFNFSVLVHCVGSKLKNSKGEENVLHLDVNSGVIRFVRKEVQRLTLKFELIHQVIYDEKEPKIVLLTCRDDQRYLIDFSTKEDTYVFRTAFGSLVDGSFDFSRFNRLIVARGLIGKKGKTGTYQERYMTIVPRKAILLSGKTALYPRAVISLAEAVPRFDEPKNALYIEVNGKEFVFRGFTRQDTHDWFLAISKACASRPLLSMVPNTLPSAITADSSKGFQAFPQGSQQEAASFTEQQFAADNHSMTSPSARMNMFGLAAPLEGTSGLSPQQLQMSVLAAHEQMLRRGQLGDMYGSGQYGGGQYGGGQYANGQFSAQRKSPEKRSTASPWMTEDIVLPTTSMQHPYQLRPGMAALEGLGSGPSNSTAAGAESMAAAAQGLMLGSGFAGEYGSAGAMDRFGSSAAARGGRRMDIFSADDEAGTEDSRLDGKLHQHSLGPSSGSDILSSPPTPPNADLRQRGQAGMQSRMQRDEVSDLENENRSWSFGSAQTPFETAAVRQPPFRSDQDRARVVSDQVWPRVANTVPVRAKSMPEYSGWHAQSVDSGNGSSHGLSNDSKDHRHDMSPYSQEQQGGYSAHQHMRQQSSVTKSGSVHMNQSRLSKQEMDPYPQEQRDGYAAHHPARQQSTDAKDGSRLLRQADIQLGHPPEYEVAGNYGPLGRQSARPQGHNRVESQGSASVRQQSGVSNDRERHSLTFQPPSVVQDLDPRQHRSHTFQPPSSSRDYDARQRRSHTFQPPSQPAAYEATHQRRSHTFQPPSAQHGYEENQRPSHTFCPPPLPAEFDDMHQRHSHTFQAPSPQHDNNPRQDRAHTYQPYSTQSHSILSREAPPSESRGSPAYSVPQPRPSTILHMRSGAMDSEISLSPRMVAESNGYERSFSAVPHTPEYGLGNAGGHGYEPEEYVKSGNASRLRAPSTQPQSASAVRTRPPSDQPPPPYSLVDEQSLELVSLAAMASIRAADMTRQLASNYANDMQAALHHIQATHSAWDQATGAGSHAVAMPSVSNSYSNPLYAEDPRSPSPDHSTSWAADGIQDQLRFPSRAEIGRQSQIRSTAGSIGVQPGAPRQHSTVAWENSRSSIQAPTAQLPDSSHSRPQSVASTKHFPSITKDEAARKLQSPVGSLSHAASQPGSQQFQPTAGYNIHNPLFSLGASSVEGQGPHRSMQSNNSVQIHTWNEPCLRPSIIADTLGAQHGTWRPRSRSRSPRSGSQSLSRGRGSLALADMLLGHARCLRLLHWAFIHYPHLPPNSPIVDLPEEDGLEHAQMPRMMDVREGVEKAYRVWLKWRGIPLTTSRRSRYSGHERTQSPSRRTSFKRAQSPSHRHSGLLGDSLSSVTNGRALSGHAQSPSSRYSRHADGGLSSGTEARASFRHAQSPGSRHSKHADDSLSSGSDGRASVRHGQSSGSQHSRFQGDSLSSESDERQRNVSSKMYIGSTAEPQSDKKQLRQNYTMSSASMRGSIEGSGVYTKGPGAPPAQSWSERAPRVCSMCSGIDGSISHAEGVCQGDHTCGCRPFLPLSPMLGTERFPSVTAAASAAAGAANGSSLMAAGSMSPPVDVHFMSTSQQVPSRVASTSRSVHFADQAGSPDYSSGGTAAEAWHSPLGSRSTLSREGYDGRARSIAASLQSHASSAPDFQTALLAAALQEAGLMEFPALGSPPHSVSRPPASLPVMTREASATIQMAAASASENASSAVADALSALDRFSPRSSRPQSPSAPALSTTNINSNFLLDERLKAVLGQSVNGISDLSGRGVFSPDSGPGTLGDAADSFYPLIMRLAKGEIQPTEFLVSLSHNNLAAILRRASEIGVGLTS